MSEADQVAAQRGIAGLLLRGAFARLQVAAAASLALWGCVLWACLSHPLPPKPDESPPSSPPALRQVVGSGQPTPVGGMFDRFDVTSQPIVAPVNVHGQVAFYATILRSKATEGIFLAGTGPIAKVAAVGDAVPGGGVITGFAKHRRVWRRRQFGARGRGYLHCQGWHDEGHRGRWRGRARRGRRQLR